MTEFKRVPDSNVHGANMGPIWGRQDEGGPHVGPMNFAIWGDMLNIMRVSQTNNDICRLLIIESLGSNELKAWE